MSWSKLNQASFLLVCSHFFEFQIEAWPSLDQLNGRFGAPPTFHLAPLSFEYSARQKCILSFGGDCTVAPLNLMKQALCASCSRQQHCTLRNLSPLELEFQVEYQTWVGIPSWIPIQIGIPRWIVDPLGECETTHSNKEILKFPSYYTSSGFGTV